MEIHKLYQLTNPLLSEEEDVLNYRAGGYHPIALNDTLKNGRYKIYHKLGHGGFSTVWVARDSKLKQWVSVKIITADRTNQSREAHTLRDLTEYSNRNPGSRYVVQLLDDFLHEGPNGCHQCLVLELFGPTVHTFMEEFHGNEEFLTTYNVRKISTNMLQAIAFIHKAGYVHGDLSVSNLAFTCDRLSGASEEELLQILGDPKKEALIRQDGKPLGEGVPQDLIKSAVWGGWLHDNDVAVDDLRIIDLGQAFHKNAIPKKIAQPFELQAPETIFAHRFNYRLDLWSAGLVIYFLIFRCLPFQCFDLGGLVAEFVEFTGELPPKWQPKYEKLRNGDRKDGQYSDWNLEQRFREFGLEPELQTLLPVIKGLTRMLPSDRISVSQALKMMRAKTLSDSRSRPSDERASVSDGKASWMTHKFTVGNEGGHGNLQEMPRAIPA